MFIALLIMLAQPPHAVPGEEAVAPYAASNANAGASPVSGRALFQTFGGKAGIDRIVAATVDASVADPRTSDIFKATDLVRLKRTLSEQVCFILAGPCDYTGRDMKTAHRDMGLQTEDLTALIEHLQVAMDIERVPFAAQNKLLAKLAPMKRVIVER